MAELPRHQALTDATGDAFCSSRLDRMLSNFAASYKLYWLRSVFDEAIAGSDVVPLRCLAARMVALAWYPVTYFRLNLGASDRLSRAVVRAHEVCDLRDDATERQIRDAVLASDDHELRRCLDDLCNFVPYRLIRPFYDALTTLRGRGRRHRGVLESYSTIDPHVWEYDRTDEARESFARSVSRVVLPLHQIATNQGFPTWAP